MIYVSEEREEREGRKTEIEHVTWSDAEESLLLYATSSDASGTSRKRFVCQKNIKKDKRGRDGTCDLF